MLSILKEKIFSLLPKKTVYVFRREPILMADDFEAIYYDGTNPNAVMDFSNGEITYFAPLGGKPYLRERFTKRPIKPNTFIVKKNGKFYYLPKEYFSIFVKI